MSGNRGKLFVITGPSGAGLHEILGALLRGRDDLGEVTPITARKMKDGERNGVGFYFYELEEWNAMKTAGGILETTEFAGNDYGTSRALVEEQLDAGRQVLLNLEAARAAQVKRNMPEAVCVVVAPSREVLRARYEAISRSAIEVSARLELAEREQAALDFGDYSICSDDREAAVRELNELMDRLSGKE